MTFEITITGFGILWTAICMFIGMTIGWYLCKDYIEAEVYRQNIIDKAKSEGRPISPWSGLPYPPTPPRPRTD